MRSSRKTFNERACREEKGFYTDFRGYARTRVVLETQYISGEELNPF